MKIEKWKYSVQREKQILHCFYNINANKLFFTAVKAPKKPAYVCCSVLTSKP